MPVAWWFMWFVGICICLHGIVHYVLRAIPFSSSLPPHISPDFEYPWGGFKGNFLSDTARVGVVVMRWKLWTFLVNRLRRLSPHFARVQKYWGEKKMYSECMEEVGDNDKGDKVKISWHLYFVIHRNCKMSTFLKLLSINLPTFSIHSLCNKWVISP